MVSYAKCSLIQNDVTVLSKDKFSIPYHGIKKYMILKELAEIQWNAKTLLKKAQPPLRYKVWKFEVYFLISTFYHDVL